MIKVTLRTWITLSLILFFLAAAVGASGQQANGYRLGGAVPSAGSPINSTGGPYALSTNTGQPAVSSSGGPFSLTGNVMGRSAAYSPRVFLPTVRTGGSNR